MCSSDLALTGKGRGVLRVDGDVRAPTLRADLVVRGLSTSDWTFGDGRVSVGLLPDRQATPVDVDDRPLVATIAASTAWSLGRYDVRASWAIDREVLAADVRAVDVDLSLLGPLVGPSAPTLLGTANVTATVQGPIDEIGRAHV